MQAWVALDDITEGELHACRSMHATVPSVLQLEGNVVHA